MYTKQGLITFQLNSEFNITLKTKPILATFYKQPFYKLASYHLIKKTYSKPYPSFIYLAPNPTLPLFTLLQTLPFFYLPCSKPYPSFIYLALNPTLPLFTLLQTLPFSKLSCLKPYPSFIYLAPNPTLL